MDSTSRLIKSSRNVLQANRRLQIMIRSQLIIWSLLVLIFCQSSNATSINVSDINGKIEFFKTDEDAQQRVLDLARQEKEQMEKELLKDKGPQNQVIFDSSNEKPNETLVNPVERIEENMVNPGNGENVETFNKIAKIKGENNQPITEENTNISSLKMRSVWPGSIDQNLNEISDNQENNTKEMDDIVNITKYSPLENEARPSPQEAGKEEQQFEGIARSEILNSESIQSEGTETSQAQNASDEVQKIEQLKDEDSINQDKILSDDVPTLIKTKKNVYDPTQKFLSNENGSDIQNSLSELMSKLNNIDREDKDGDSNSSMDAISLSQQNANLSPEMERQTEEYNNLQAQANLSNTQNIESNEVLNSEEKEEDSEKEILPSEQINSSIDDEEINQLNSSLNYSSNIIDRGSESAVNSNDEQKENSSVFPETDFINSNSLVPQNFEESPNKNIENYKDNEQKIDKKNSNSNDEPLAQSTMNDLNETNSSKAARLNEDIKGSSLQQILALFNKNTLALNSETTDNGSLQKPVPLLKPQYINTQNNVITTDIEEGSVTGVPMEVPAVIQANINILSENRKQAQISGQTPEKYNLANMSKGSENTIRQELSSSDPAVNIEERESPSVSNEIQPTEQNGEVNNTENTNNMESEQTPETQLERYPDFNDESENLNSDKNRLLYKEGASILRKILFGNKSVQKNKGEEDIQQNISRGNNQEDSVSEPYTSKQTPRDQNNEPIRKENIMYTSAQTGTLVQPDVEEDPYINEDKRTNAISNNSVLNDYLSDEINSKPVEMNSRSESEGKPTVDSEELNKENVSPTDLGPPQKNQPLAEAGSLLYSSPLKAPENLNEMEQLKKQNEEIIQEILNVGTLSVNNDKEKETNKFTTEPNILSPIKTVFEASNDENILTQNLEKILEKGTNMFTFNLTGQGPMPESNRDNNELNKDKKHSEILMLEKEGSVGKFDSDKLLQNKLMCKETPENTIKESTTETIPCFKGGETDMKKDEPLSLFSHFPPTVYTDRGERERVEKLKLNGNYETATSPDIDVRDKKFNIDDDDGSRNDKTDYVFEGEHSGDNTSSPAESKLFKDYSPNIENAEVMTITGNGSAKKNSSLNIQKTENKSTVFSIIDLIRGPNSKIVLRLDPENGVEKDIISKTETDNSYGEKEYTNDKLPALIGAKDNTENKYRPSNETEAVGKKPENQLAGKHSDLSVNIGHIGENHTQDNKFGTSFNRHSISKRTSTAEQDLEGEEDAEEEDLDEVVKKDDDEKSNSKVDEKEKPNDTGTTKLESRLIHKEPNAGDIFFNDEAITNDTASGKYYEKIANEENAEEFSSNKGKEDNYRGIEREDDDEDDERRTDKFKLKHSASRNQNNETGTMKEDSDNEDEINDKIPDTKESEFNSSSTMSNFQKSLKTFHDSFILKLLRGLYSPFLPQAGLISRNI